MNIILIGFGHICKSAYLPWTISNRLVEKVYIYDAFISKKEISEHISIKSLNTNLKKKLRVLDRIDSLNDVLKKIIIHKCFILTNHSTHFDLAV